MPKKLKSKVLVTGSSGFIGEKLMRSKLNGFEFIPCSVRHNNVDSLSLKGYRSIVHLGGVAHRMDEPNPQVYFDGNYELTRNLADKAKRQGVEHFVFISTIKAFGEGEEYLSHKSVSKPMNDPYGESKLQAEHYLERIAAEEFKIAIIRPPLVYGAGAKGNLFALMKLAEKPIPLPLKGINNRRTMVSAENLISMIGQIIDQRATGLFLAGDSCPVSTSQLITSIRRAMGLKPRLIKIPLFQSLLKILKPQLEMRLFGSLEMEVYSSFQLLNFSPPYSFDQGIQTMVNWYLANK